MVRKSGEKTTWQISEPSTVATYFFLCSGAWSLRVRMEFGVQPMATNVRSGLIFHYFHIIEDGRSFEFLLLRRTNRLRYANIPGTTLKGGSFRQTSLEQSEHRWMNEWMNKWMNEWIIEDGYQPNSRGLSYTETLANRQASNLFFSDGDLDATEIGGSLGLRKVPGVMCKSFHKRERVG